MNFIYLLIIVLKCKLKTIICTVLLTYIYTFISFVMLFHCGLMQYNDTYVDHHILNEKLYTENLRSSNTNPTKNQG